MTTAPNRLCGVITCHAWNKDGSKIAVCPNNNEIRIYAKSGSNFTLEHTLTEHDQVVTGIDWAPNSNRIVTCSQDRNAYVWTLEGGKWKPVLVILRVNRGATHVKWSPKEDKFAVSTGAKLVSVCYFEEDNDWWVSKHIKRHKSTVLKVDWHPNNVLLATASSDFKVRVFSGYIKGVDKGEPPSPFTEGKIKTFGEVFAEIDTQGWAHSVKWSPSGSKLAWVSHDSAVSVADVSSGTPAVQTVKEKILPHRDLVWVSEDAIVAAGHANAPYHYSVGGGLKPVKSLDSGEGKAAPAAAAGTQKSAMAMFQNKVDRGAETAGKTTSINTKHQNCVTYIAVYPGGKLTTTGVDGYVFEWPAPK